jgi:hypothetical protein
MARANFQAALDAIKTLLEANITGLTVFVEQDPVFGLSDMGKAVVVLLRNRTLSGNQGMAAGKTNRWSVFIQLWVTGFSAESYKKAAEIRDELLGEVELVLMQNRTLSGTVGQLQLEGGVFQNAQNDSMSAFGALAELMLKAEITAVNT